MKQLLVASTNFTTSTMSMVDGSVQKSGGNSAGGNMSAVGSAAGGGNVVVTSKAEKKLNNQAAILASMSTMHHFNEFVKAFCDFGSDMVHLIRISTGKSISTKSNISLLDYVPPLSTLSKRDKSMTGKKQ